MLRLNAYQLKWIAIIGMILNHMVFAWYEILPIWLMFPLYAVGGLTFPIMAYFVVEGYKHTSNLKKYLLRLLIFGVIAIPFHLLVFRTFLFNILFTIILSLILLILYDRMKKRVLFWLIFVLVLPVTLMVDWYFVGVVVVLLYHVIRNENVRRVVPSIVAGISWLLLSLLSILGMAIYQAKTSEIVTISWGGVEADMNFLWVGSTFIIGCLGAAVLLKGYNGERGKRMKWLFYLIYPLHLAILGGIAFALGLVDVSTFW